jgi:uncharacterized membrane protein
MKMLKNNGFLTLRSSKLPSFLVFLIILLAFTETNPIIYGQTAAPTTKNENVDYKVDSLFVALLTNGDASIDYNLVINSGKPITNVTLFGVTVQNLTLTDYNETNIRYTPTAAPNKIQVYLQASPDIHVTYTTPDLVDKQNRNWTFSFFFPDRFLLKMPSQAHIIQMNPQPFLTPSNEQNLWGFGPGKVEVSYIIGPLGTREEAQASIRTIEDAIKGTVLNYDGIILSNATAFLEKAKSAFKQDKYFDAVTYSTNALTMLQNTSQNYILGKNTISQAEADLEKKRNSGYDISEENKTLSTARALFLTGDYEKAGKVAREAISQSNPTPDTFMSPVKNDNLIIILTLLVAATLGILLFVRKRKKSTGVLVMKEQAEDNSGSHDLHNSMDGLANLKKPESGDSNITKSKVQNLSPLHLNMSADSPDDVAEIKDHLKKVIEEVGIARKTPEPQDKANASLYPLEDKSIDRVTLSQVILKMKSERPYLRNEDKNLLDFLGEKQGSAFESEIRNKFILPRTSLWRLIKRLEREELVEVRKIGGQNLIKLRFEGK